jgi:AraC-like DNA-binding protein
VVDAMGLEARKIDPEEWMTMLASPQASFEVDDFYHGYYRRRTADSGSAVQRRLEKHCMKMSVHGAQSLLVGGEERNLEPGGFLWIAPGVEVLESPAGSHACYYVQFELKLEGQALRLEEDVVELGNAWEILQYFKQLVVEADTSRWEGGQRLRSLMSLLCIGIFRLRSARRKKEPVLSEDQCHEITSYFADHACERLSSADLAGAVNLSQDYFTRLFRATFGEPPRKWMVRQRLRLAAEKLKATSVSIKEVAYALGYDDVYLFSRQFRSFIGMSPRAFRRAR